MKDVFVEIHSLQNGREISYIYTLGKMKTLRNHGCTVELYTDEPAFNSTDSFSITMTGDDKVILNSGKGKNLSRFIFEKGEPAFSSFSDPSRSGITAVKAQCLESELDSHGGRLDLRYTVDFSNMPPVINELKIKISAQSKTAPGIGKNHNAGLPKQ